MKRYVAIGFIAGVCVALFGVYVAVLAVPIWFMTRRRP